MHSSQTNLLEHLEHPIIVQLVHSFIAESGKVVAGHKLAAIHLDFNLSKNNPFEHLVHYVPTNPQAKQFGSQTIILEHYPKFSTYPSRHVVQIVSVAHFEQPNEHIITPVSVLGEVTVPFGIQVYVSSFLLYAAEQSETHLDPSKKVKY